MEQKPTRNETRPRASGRRVKYMRYATVYLRLALAVGFLSAVADRFGIWGAPGAHLVAWGNFHNFLRYTAILNPWFPRSWIPAIGWLATICEAALGLALLVGFRIRSVAFCSGILSLGFAVGMICGLGVKAPLNYSVFVVSAAGFVLASQTIDPWSADSWGRRAAKTCHSPHGIDENSKRAA